MEQIANIFNTSVDFLLGKTDDSRPVEMIKEELELYKKKIPDQPMLK